MEKSPYNAKKIKDFAEKLWNSGIINSNHKNKFVSMEEGGGSVSSDEKDPQFLAGRGKKISSIKTKTRK